MLFSCKFLGGGSIMMLTKDTTILSLAFKRKGRELVDLGPYLAIGSIITLLI